MLASSGLVNAQVASDGVKPRRKLGLPLVRLRALDDAHERFLQQILGGLLVADEAKDEVVHRLSVPVEQQLERANLSPLVQDHEVFVGVVGLHSRARSATFVGFFRPPHYLTGKPRGKPTYLSNAHAVDRLRGLTRWTVIRSPSLEAGSLDCRTTPHARLPGNQAI